MTGEDKKEVGESVTSTDTESKKVVKKTGVLSKLWNALFRVHGDDFEKRLQHISKEEASVLGRITRRSQSRLRTTRHLIIFSVLFELIAVVYAILTTRSLGLNWKMRALRVLPMFLLPALSFITYMALRSFSNMCDRKDKKILERLRDERQTKIDELKEKTNYYITQQLIQRYDPDPAAKAAAATVLASKLGADSGLKVYVGDEATITSATTGKGSEAEVGKNIGLRNRKASHSKTSRGESLSTHQPEEDMATIDELEGANISQKHQMVTGYHPQTGSNAQNGGWIARLAALLVGEDPTQSYALICQNCHMHNGLARKEDFLYITYYCPHCNALNRPNQPDEQMSESNSSTITSLAPVEVTEVVSAAEGFGDTVSTKSTLVAAAAKISES